VRIESQRERRVVRLRLIMTIVLSMILCRDALSHWAR
jgi:hypothetical protein